MLPNGEVQGQVTAPYQERGERPFTLTLTEVDQPANTASAASRVTALAFRLKPRKKAPSQRVRFIGRGFTDGEFVYAHYVRKGKLRKTVLLGAAQGPCGRIDVRRRQIPITGPPRAAGRCRSTTRSATAPSPSASSCAGRSTSSARRAPAARRRRRAPPPPRAAPPPACG